MAVSKRQKITLEEVDVTLSISEDGRMYVSVFIAPTVDQIKTLVSDFKPAAKTVITGVSIGVLLVYVAIATVIGCTVGLIFGSIR